MTSPSVPSVVAVFSLLLLLHPQLPSAAAAGRRRSLLRALSDGPDPPDAAVDLNSTNFDSVLRGSPASFAVVEFFAHWCPACRNYKAQYEKVARLFNGADAVHPGILLMARVDCATKMNTDICDRFSVAHYPMLVWGSPHKIASGRWVPNQENNEIQQIDDARTADQLLNWINKRIGSSFNLDDEKYENENTLPQNASDPDQIARAVYDIEEATTKAFDIIVEHKMIKSDTRTPLVKFLQLLVAHHPSKRCRRGSADILVNVDDIWPNEILTVNPREDSISLHEKDALKAFLICGKDVPRGYWMLCICGTSNSYSLELALEAPRYILVLSPAGIGMFSWYELVEAILIEAEPEARFHKEIFCRGSKNDTRGFSCGLWVLMHSLSVRVGDGESHFAFTAICDFIHNFFICEECRSHFYEMCSSVSAPLNTTRDLALWLWSTHNRVNERLMKEEKDLGIGDPRFPKIIWPSKQLCPSCYLSSSRKSSGAVHVDWVEDEVFKFLVTYYGKNLMPSSKEAGMGGNRNDESPADDVATSTNSLAVPVGAALCIALASCTFGALACFWRAQQKNRKYFHQLRSLKNI